MQMGQLFQTIALCKREREGERERERERFVNTSRLLQIASNCEIERSNNGDLLVVTRMRQCLAAASCSLTFTDISPSRRTSIVTSAGPLHYIAYSNIECPLAYLQVAVSLMPVYDVYYKYTLGHAVS